MDGPGDAGERRPRRLGTAVVRGRSMQPTLYDGDRLLVLHGGCPRPGALVVVRLPAEGGGPRRDPVYAVKRAVRRETDGWWVERDNPREGVDSWTVGTVPDREVMATVVLRWWPLVRRVSAGPHPP